MKSVKDLTDKILSPEVVSYLQSKVDDWTEHFCNSICEFHNTNMRIDTSTLCLENAELLNPKFSMEYAHFIESEISNRGFETSIQVDGAIYVKYTSDMPAIHLDREDCLEEVDDDFYEDHPSNESEYEDSI